MNNDTPKTQVIIPARLSYAYVWEPSDKSGKYSAQLLVDKDDTKTLKKIDKAIQTAIEVGKTKLANNKGVVPKNIKLPLHDGDDGDKDGEEYEGMMYFNASSNQKPSICDRRREPITDEAKVYSGCYANVAVKFYAFAVEGNKGIAAGLQAIQKVKDGERLGGGYFNSDNFDDLGDDDDDFDFDDED